MCDFHKENMQVEPFQTQRGSLTIRGKVYRMKKENLPIAIVCHGFMATSATVKQYAKVLAEKGYAAFIFDFCGGCALNGKSDGKTTNMSVLSEVKDLESVIAYASSQKYTDPNNILLMGCSQGGFVCALEAAKNKFLVKKLILFYPALCIPDDARAGHMMFAKFDPHNIPEYIQCGPMKLGKMYAADVLHMDPYKEIADYKEDVLIVHGAKDDIVNPQYAKKAYETYRKSNPHRRAALHIIDNGHHGFFGSSQKQAVQILKDFLDA